MKARDSICTILLIAWMPLIGEGLEPYKLSSEPGIQSYASRYYMTGSWHLTCTVATSGRSKGSKWIELEKTTGEKYPRTGFYQTGGNDPKVEIWNVPNQRKSLTIKVGYQCLRDTPVVITADGTKYEKIWEDRPDTREWRGKDAEEILRAMMTGKTIAYSYIDGARTRREGTTDLEGFEDLLKIAVEFVGYNPLIE